MRLRQDCPGKATHTVLLTCVSAADVCHEATLQTLRFAERARSRNLPGAVTLAVCHTSLQESIFIVRVLGSAHAEHPDVLTYSAVCGLVHGACR